MKIIRFVLSENFMFLEVKFSIYLNRRVFVMDKNRTMTFQRSDPNVIKTLPFYLAVTATHICNQKVK